jgi:hypothetical protein
MSLAVGRSRAEEPTDMDRDVRALAEDLRNSMDQAADRAVDYLSSPSGRRLRRGLAAAMIVGAPLIFRAPGLRRHPLIRFLDVIGGAAAVMELARLIRDWEPDLSERLEAAVAGAPNVRAGGNGSGPAR